MHILITPSWYPKCLGDFNGSFFREQAQALHKAGHRVGVIFPHLRSLRDWQSILSGSYRIEEFNDDGVNTMIGNNMNWFARLPCANDLFVKQGIKLFKRYINQYGKPDIIHAHSILCGGFLAYMISIKYKIPFLITEHSSIYSRNLIKPWQQKQINKIIKKSRRLFAVSSSFADLLTTLINTGQLRWETMPNLVEQNFLTHPLKLGLGQNFTFITVASLREQKKISNLIIAFVNVFRSDPNVFLQIGGDGPELLRLQAMVKDFGVANQIQFLGRLDRAQVVAYISAADVFVLPSNYETFGVVVIEALALGRPVIATACGGPEDILSDGDGQIVPPDNIQELSKAMLKVRGEYLKYQPENIRSRCKMRFSSKVIATRLTAVYSEIVQNYMQELNEAM